MAAATAGCSGGASGGDAPAPAGARSALRGTIHFSVKWPPKKATAGSRRPAYFSPNTASVQFTITPPGGSALSSEVDNPNYVGNTAAGSTGTSTIAIAAPLGTSDVKIAAYDALGGAAGSGKLLSAVDLPSFTVVETQANDITATLDGNLAKIASMATPSTYLTGTDPAYTIYGAVPETLALVPLDADGNVIIAPGAIPALALTSGTPGAVSVAAGSNSTQYTIQGLEPDQTVTLTAKGTNLGGTAVTEAIAIKTIGLLYVTNRGSGTGTSPSVTIYPSNATANVAPFATIAGASTQEVQVEYPAADPAGDVLVSNLGPVPGPSPNIGPTSGYVTAFTPASVPLTLPPTAAMPVDTAPSSTIAAINKPTGLSFDAAGNLYVMSVDRINVYPPTANGLNGTTATPSRTISGANTQLSACYGVFVGKDGLVYAACSNLIAIFAATATGNVAPVQTIHGPGTVFMNGAPVAQGSVSWLSVAADTAGNIYTASANNNNSQVYIYAKGTNDPATGSAPAPNTIVTGAPGATFYEPSIFVDAADKIYVTNVANPGTVATPGSVEIFASMMSLVTGTPAATITTGIAVPMGAYVR